MEALAAIGLASGIVQFADCGIRWALSAKELYTGGTGILKENSELEKVIESLRFVVNRLKKDDRLQGDDILDALVAACSPLSDELSAILNTLKVEERKADLESKEALKAEERRYGRLSSGDFLSAKRVEERKRSRRESFKKALMSLWKRGRIQEISRRLEMIRDQIYAHVNFLLASEQATLLPSLRELTDIQKAMATSTHDTLKEMSSQLQNMATLTAQNGPSWHQDSSTVFASLVQKFENRLNNKISRLIKSLYFEQLPYRHSQVKQAHKNTFEWVFDIKSSVNLRSWLRCRGGIYWVSGKAGSGKSTLMKFLQEDSRTRHLLQEWAGAHKIVIASHFFWSAGTPMQKSQNGLFRTLLSQIFTTCPELATLICSERWDDDSIASSKGWMHEELCLVFHRLSALEQVPKRFCFLIDGLDEYDGDHQELAELLDGISRSRNIKICASSRPWNDFIDAFGQSQWKLFVHELTEDDMRLYIKENLEQNHRFLRLQARQAAAAEGLAHEVYKRSEGVFLWVYLVIKSLLRGVTNRDEIHDLKRRLDELPSDLEQYFELMMNHIEKVYQARTSHIFRTLIEAEGTLPLLALRFLDMEQYDPEYAVGKAIQPSNKAVIDAIVEEKMWQLNAQCKDLLEAGQSPEKWTYLGETFGFLHRTVIDFMRGERIFNLLKTRSRPEFDPALTMCKISLAQFKFRPIDGSVAITKQITPYFVSETLTRARELELRSDRSEAALLDDFFETTSTAQGLLRYDWASMTPAPCCFICVAAKYGLLLYVSQNFERCSGGAGHLARLLHMSLNPQSITAPSGLPLKNTNSLAVLQFLLEKGISPNLPFNDVTIWADYLEGITKAETVDGVSINANDDGALEKTFEFCRLMISHGADRWMRSYDHIEPYQFDPKNDVMPLMDEIFSHDQCAMLRSLYVDSSAECLPITFDMQAGYKLLEKHHSQNRHGSQFSRDNLFSYKPNTPGNGSNRGGSLRGRGYRGGYRGSYGRDTTSGQASLLRCATSSSVYPYPSNPQSEQPVAFYTHSPTLQSQTQASEHFATQFYIHSSHAPPQQYPFDTPPGVPTAWQPATQSCNYSSRLPYGVPFYASSGIGSIVSSDRLPGQLAQPVPMLITEPVVGGLSQGEWNRIHMSRGRGRGYGRGQGSYL